MKKVGNTWIQDGDKFFERVFSGSDTFESQNLELALSFVKKWDIAYDVGAHYGSWTRAMAAEFDLVVAFEPNPDNYNCLLLNNPYFNVIPVPCGLSNQNEEVSLESGNNSGCWHVVEGRGIKLITPPDYGALDFIKIDVEGHEGIVIDGCLELLKKYRPIVLIEEKDLPHKKCDYAARKLLESNGYKQLAAIGRDVIFGH